MNFLPRRRGQSFGGFGGRTSRPRRRGGFMRVTQPASTSYIETSGAITLAATTSANYSVLLCSDSPNKALITDLASGIAQVENNSKILKKGSFIQFNIVSNTTPGIVNIWVWLNTKGAITTPTNAFDFSTAPTTEDNIQLREKTIAFRQVSLSTTEFRTIRVPLGARRNNFLVDPASQLVVTVHNQTGNTISYTAFGRIKTLEG